MQTVQVILIFVVLFGAVALMMTKKLPAILALPLIGILVAFIAGVPFMTPGEDEQTICSFVINAGSGRLASTIIVTIFGAIFAKLIEKQGIAENIIHKAAELAGDKPLAMALALTAATVIIFVGMSGAGPVIMVCTIAVPLLLAAGVTPVVSASLILLGLTVGLMINVSQYQMYIDTLGMTQDQVRSMSVVLAVIGAIVTVAYIVINVRRKPVRSSWAMPAADNERRQVNPVALVMPLLPFILVFFLKIDALTSLIIAILITVLITTPRKIVSVLSGTVPVVHESHGIAIGILHFIAVGILFRLNSHSLEGNELVLMVDQLVRAKQSRHILRLGNIISIHDFKGCVNDLNLAGPLSLVACNLDLCSGSQLLIILLGACHVVYEISAVLILCVNSCLVLPPGLLCLNISLNHNLSVEVCCHIFRISHDSL